jgi:hypothetical protein
MTNRPLGAVIALTLGSLVADCGTKVLTQDPKTGTAGQGVAGAVGGGFAGAGGIGGGGTAGNGANGGGGAGCIYGSGGMFGGSGGMFGDGGNGAGGRTCLTHFACGSSPSGCALGQEFCYTTRGGAGSSGSGGFGGDNRTGDSQTCRGLPAACAGNPSCDCVCPNGLDNCPGFGFGCTCNFSNGALWLSCGGAGGAGGAGGTGGAGGCPNGFAGFNGSAAGNGGGGSSGIRCATPPLCGSSTCAPDQEYCRSITVEGGAGKNGSAGGLTGNTGSGGSGGAGGAGGMTDPNNTNTCTSLPASCSGHPSCACACPDCPTNGVESCSCSVVGGEVIVHCIELGA